MAALGYAPEFCGVGTDRSAQILQVARDARCEWTATALANVPSGLRQRVFEERTTPNGAAGSLPRASWELPAEPRSPRRATRQRTDGIPPVHATASYVLPPPMRSGCVFGLEDTTAAPGRSQPPSGEHPSASGAQSVAGDGPFDLILCRYSIFLYSSR